MCKCLMLNGPAARAKLKPTRRDEEGEIHFGDVIQAIDSQPIKTVNDLFSALEQHKVEDTVTLTIVREGQQQDVKVTLQAGE